MFQVLILVTFLTVFNPTVSQSVFRLVNAEGVSILSQQEGLLLHNSRTVCDDHFNETAANAVCRNMGFDFAVTWSSSEKWTIQGRYQIGLDDVRCPVPDWTSCNYITTSHNCGHVEDVFLTCSGARSPFSLTDRRGFTVKGDEDHILLYDGGAVCTDQFSDDSAYLVCNDLGYAGGAAQWRAAPLPYSSLLPTSNLSFSCSSRDKNTCRVVTDGNCESGSYVYITCQHEIKENKESPEENQKDREWALKQESENLAIKILMAVCIVLVLMLVRKNSQIDQKDLQIRDFAKSCAMLKTELNNIQMMIRNIEPRNKEVLLSDVD